MYINSEDYYDGYSGYDEEMEYTQNRDYKSWSQEHQERKALEKIAYEAMLIAHVVKINPRLSEYDKMLLGLRR